MIYLTKDLINIGETEYSIRKLIKKGKLFLIGRGIYSNKPEPYINEHYVTKIYPNSILTGVSAFYLYDLTDHVPDGFHLATEQHSFPIKRNEIIQSYQDPSFFEVGKTTINLLGEEIVTYDLERLLIELIRLKEKYPREIYYEVLASFRKIALTLDFQKINVYLKYFKNGSNLLEKIKEVI